MRTTLKAMVGVGLVVWHVAIALHRLGRRADPLRSRARWLVDVPLARRRLVLRETSSVSSTLETELGQRQARELSPLRREEGEDARQGGLRGSTRGDERGEDNGERVSAALYPLAAMILWLLAVLLILLVARSV